MLQSFPKKNREPIVVQGAPSLNTGLLSSSQNKLAHFVPRMRPGSTGIEVHVDSCTLSGRRGENVTPTGADSRSHL